MTALLASVAVVGCIGIPAQVAYRGPDGQGDNIRLAARIVARRSRVGDAVLFEPPWWRRITAAYPGDFRRLRDIALVRTPAQVGNFTGTRLPPARIRRKLAKIRRVWLIEFMVFRPSPVLGRHWRVAERWRAATLVLTLYRRVSPRPATSEVPGAGARNARLPPGDLGDFRRP